jgi:cytochrome c biogenesis protein CcdA
MLIYLLAFVGGVLTILSPCILPVLPFVQGNRLYQLIRQKGAVEDRTFEIDFLDPGVEAFAFTFG